jgi:hypothetical protein
MEPAAEQPAPRKKGDPYYPKKKPRTFSENVTVEPANKLSESISNAFNSYVPTKDYYGEYRDSKTADKVHNHSP